MARSTSVLLAVGLAVLAAPSSAPAAQRYATPTGSGSACSQVAPCDLVTAVNSASSSDEVIVAGDQGSYGTPGTPISTKLNPPTINLHGATGQPRPVIYSNASPWALEFNSGGTLSYLDFEQLNSGAWAIIAIGTIDRLIARGGTIGCGLFGGTTVIDSACSGTSAGLSSQVFCACSTPFALTLRNLTAWSDSGNGMQFTADFPYTINATNVIARGGSNDVSASVSGSGSVTVNFDHSNYATTQAGAGTTITPAGSGTNQTAAPLLVDAAGGDFHQAPGSPTIDAGVNDPANGSTDFDGDPRTLNGVTDIGADEFVPPPPSGGGGGGGGPSPPVDTTAPAFTSASLTNTVFAVDRRGPPATPVAARAVRKGTTFKYTLTEVARVLFTIERELPGRKVGARCVRPGRSNRGRRRCTRYLLFGRFAQQAVAGRNSTRWAGSIGRRRLAPGRYRATLVATDPAGNRSRPKRLRFTVVRG